MRCRWVLAVGGHSCLKINSNNVELNIQRERLAANPRVDPGSCIPYPVCVPADRDREILYRNWLEPLVPDTMDTFINDFSPPPNPSPPPKLYRPSLCSQGSFFNPSLSALLASFIQRSLSFIRHAVHSSKMSRRQQARWNRFRFRINYIWKIYSIHSYLGPLLFCNSY